jgi:MFS family permease
LIKKITPDSLTGRVFGVVMSAQYLGGFGGSVLGGQVAAWFGIRWIGIISKALAIHTAKHFENIIGCFLYKFG